MNELKMYIALISINIKTKEKKKPNNNDMRINKIHVIMYWLGIGLSGVVWCGVRIHVCVYAGLGIICLRVRAILDRLI